MSTTHTGFESTDVKSRAGGWAVAVIGIVLSLVVVTDPLLRPDRVWLIEVVIELSLSAILIYGGYRLARSDIDTEELLKIDALCLKGMFSLGGFAAGIIVAAKVSGWPVGDPYFIVQTLATSGALLGVVVGMAGLVGPIRLDSDTRPTGQTTVSPEIVDEWLDVLADRRCRYVLERAMSAPDGLLTLDELTTADAVRESSRKLKLRHIVLPKLQDVRLVDYDERTETIRYQHNPAFEELFETTERYRQ